MAFDTKETLADLDSFEAQLALVKKTAVNFARRAQVHDENGTFPFENIKELRAINYPALTVPKRYGGGDISLHHLLKFQETLASYDGSTALAIGWHLGITKNIDEKAAWDEEIYADFCQDVVKNGALINTAATEPATGSPTRGGRPETYAVETDAGWLLHGRKSFATLSPVLDYFIVTASIEGTDDVGSFLVRKGTKGLAIDETWDSVAMKATGSHDLVLENVEIRREDLLQIQEKKRDAQGWLLHIPAVYLGIAKASRDYAASFATSYAPNNMKGSISDFPSVKQRLGEMELLVFESETLLYATARKWDESDAETRQTLGAELSSVKLLVVNKAVEIVDLAMRIVGARSLSATCPLQRYYRDVRAGLHNPPMDDMTILTLAEQAIKTFKN